MGTAAEGGGRGVVHQHVRAWIHVGGQTATELGFRPAQLGDRTRSTGGLGISMSTLVQFEHVTRNVGLHELGQRIYYADAYWHWANTTPGLPAPVQVGYAAGWG